MKKFIEENALLSESDSCLAAVSGGADSMCMLDLLDEYCREKNIRLAVVTVNHGFRPEAVSEADYVESFCRDRGILFFLKEIKPGECEKSEEAARNFRYMLIEEVAEQEGFNKVALAHNAGDKAETMLFNLFRGSGINGLAGIRAQREQYIRPVLFMDRADIEAYLDFRGIKYVTDSSNLTNDYSRNKIRHNIIPVALEINEESVKHMNETADSLARIAAYIDRQAQEAYANLVEDKETGKCIKIAPFCELDEVIGSELIRKVLYDMTPKLKDITAEHIRSILKLACGSKNGSVCLPYRIRAYKEYDYLRISADTNDDEDISSVSVSISEIEKSDSLKLEVGNTLFEFRIIDVPEVRKNKNLTDLIPRNKYTKWFDCDKIKKSMELRMRKEGDFLTVDGEGHHKSVNRCLIDLKIPQALRDRIILVADEDEVLWIAGYRESFAYRVNEETDRILEIRLVEEKNG